MELVDSGYQMVCMSGTLASPTMIGNWLADQLGWQANPTEKIVNIDSFQVIAWPTGGFYCIAVCRICKQD